MPLCGITKINENVFRIPRSKARALYNAMKPVKEGERLKVENLLEGIKDISIQIGKIIYPSHYAFLTLEHGNFYNDDDEVWVYVTRLDGSLGVIPEILAERSGIDEIKILEIYESSTSQREPKGGYYFHKPEEDRLLKFKVIAITPDKERELGCYHELVKFYQELSTAMRTVYQAPELAQVLRAYNHYRRDGYL